MKLGTTIMDSQKIPIYSMEEDTAVKRNARGPLKFVIAALMALLLVGAIALLAAFIGGKIANDTIQSASYTFHTRAGQEIEEEITVTDTEEDIGLKDGSRIVYDFSKGIMVMKVTEDGEDICYLTSFDTEDMHLPTERELESMERANVSVSDKMDYYVDKSKVVNPAILSKRSRDICADSNLYWMSSTLKEDKTGRNRRRCRRVCRFSCSCCPRDCRITCGMECSW